MSKNNYLHITYQEALTDYKERLQADERFKNLSSASIYHMFMEMMASAVDTTNFYMQRTAEESYIGTARLDSSHIKWSKNLGYNPTRKTPSQAEIAITIQGPLPTNLKEGAEVFFSTDKTEFTFSGNKYMLAENYSYKFTKKDITDGASSTWKKTIVWSVPHIDDQYLVLQGVKLVNKANARPIKVYQGEVVKKVIYGNENYSKVGKNYQIYDIDDVNFSNWYGKRDPFAYTDGKYYPLKGKCKVGIGKTEESAFSEDGIFEIEDESIYLNDKVMATDGQEPLNVCRIESNWDKTIRINFGDGIMVTNGLNTENNNIYVQYVKCEGSATNMIGTTGSVLKCNSTFYATQQGNIIDISSNITFTFNSDISGGVDFDSQQTMKNNAPMYYASCGRLVTKQDFISYLKGLTTPVNVKNAIVWGQEEVENNSGTIYKYLQNIICYCLCGMMYKKDGENYAVRNVFDTDDTSFDAFSVYGSNATYLQHLVDYIKMVKSFSGLIDQQYQKNPTEQWKKNIKEIYKNAEPKMEIVSKMLCLPPLTQYFDVVGTVLVDPLTDIPTYKTDVENEIYAWLDENCDFNTEIYKSDITKFFTDHSETYSANIDIKVSSLIKSDTQTLTFRKYGTNLSVNDIQLAITDNMGYDETKVKTHFNCFCIPSTSLDGTTITAETLEDKSITILLNAHQENVGNRKQSYSIRSNDVVDNGDGTISINLYGMYSRLDTSTLTDIDEIDITISFPTDKDLFEDSSLDYNNANNYNNIDEDTYNSILKALADWLDVGDAYTTTEADRPIALPYEISTDVTYGSTTRSIQTRLESIIRKGISKSYELQYQLSEKSFWVNFVGGIMCKAFGIDYTTKADDSKWIGLSNMAMDIYDKIKVILCDFCLDDNNNIVRFSMDNEIPVVRLNLTYKYKEY